MTQHTGKLGICREEKGIEQRCHSEPVRFSGRLAPRCFPNTASRALPQTLSGFLRTKPLSAGQFPISEAFPPTPFLKAWAMPQDFSPAGQKLFPARARTNSSVTDNFIADKKPSPPRRRGLLCGFFGVFRGTSPRIPLCCAGRGGGSALHSANCGSAALIRVRLAPHSSAPLVYKGSCQRS